MKHEKLCRIKITVITSCKSSRPQTTVVGKYWQNMTVEQSLYILSYVTTPSGNFLLLISSLSHYTAQAEYRAAHGTT